jgi:hypothetical protein
MGYIRKAYSMSPCPAWIRDPVAAARIPLARVLPRLDLDLRARQDVEVPDVVEVWA